ncbi:hypothetical protein SUGI_0374250 [Cryptomeria japonica]|nr:hypothetical protein SUGI_0374250 [Cryptomeria japonica]
MGGGTGLNFFQNRFPERCFHVGIAERHAVVHDIDLKNLPVRFAMDRAGLVRADSPTYCGAFDITYMACLPNMVVMASSDEIELFHMVATAVAIVDQPSFFRCPKGNGIDVPPPPNYKGTPVKVGKARILGDGTLVAILGFGSIVQNSLAAEEVPHQQGISVAVADACFCKPLDGDLLRRLVKTHEMLVNACECKSLLCSIKNSDKNQQSNQS